MAEEAKATQPTMDEAVKAASGKTILYKITCDCYWNDIMWHKDDRVELPADLKPLEYFEKVTK